MKKRITITINENLIEEIRRWQKENMVKNRSYAIEYLLKKSLETKVKKAVILAGGKDKFKNILKPMVNIKNKPILEWQIRFLKKHDIEDIILIINSNREQIKRYFGDGSRFGVRINYIEEEMAKGTAAALKKIKHLVNSSFLLLYGDSLFDLDINSMLRFHKNNNASITIALKALPKTEQYGNVFMEGNRVVEFKEKPGSTISNLISVGFFVVEPHILKECENVKSFEKEVLPRLLKKNSIYGYIFTGQWFDIGSEKSYKKAREEWMKNGWNF